MIKANLLDWGFPDLPELSRNQAQPESPREAAPGGTMWSGTMAFSQVTTVYKDR